MSSAPAFQRFVDWFRAATLPLWIANGYDDARGGFFESLDFDGRPVRDARRRVRVQARQIHVFANAARRGWHADAARLAKAGFDFFLDKACPDDGVRGCIHVLSPDGAVLDDRRDLYDQAFLLLACASVWQAFRDERARALADRAMAFLDRELASPSGGWREDDAGTLPRRQNPHMHLFEAFMALHAATGEARWRGKADAVLALFDRHFFAAERGVLQEFFKDDFQRADSPKGDLVEPGHMAEWIWLLGAHREQGGAGNEAAQQMLFENAARFGADPASGFLVDQLAFGETPAGKTRRLWPQTEYLKAALALAQRGDKAAASRAGDIVERLFGSYLDQPVRGLWCDQYDGAGKPIAKDAPASILYHLHDAAAAVEAHLRDPKA